MDPLDQILAEEDPYEEEDEDDHGLDANSVEEMEHQTWIAGVLARHYHRKGVIGNPDLIMPVDWELEMGPAFAEAQAEANANVEGADSSAPDVDAGAGEIFAEGPEAGSAEGGGSELGAGDLGSGDMADPDFSGLAGGDFGGDFGGFGGGGL